MKQCDAKTRSGGRCKKPPMKNCNRCKLHGGKSLKGTASASYKHGIYSKYASHNLKTVLDELKDQDLETLMNPENEIRLMQALLISATALKKDLSDTKELETVCRVVHQLILSKQRSQQILLEEKRLIPAHEVSKLLDYLYEIMETRVPDQAITIMTEIQKFKID